MVSEIVFRIATPPHATDVAQLVNQAYHGPEAAVVYQFEIPNQCDLFKKYMMTASRPPRQYSQVEERLA